MSWKQGYSGYILTIISKNLAPLIIQHPKVASNVQPEKVITHICGKECDNVAGTLNIKLGEAQA